MKSTGIVRKLDDLGRITMPVEVRRALNIEIKDPLEIFVNGDKIIFQKYKPSNACMITGEVSDQNLHLNNGNIVLSPQGAEQLIHYLEDYLNQQQK